MLEQWKNNAPGKKMKKRVEKEEEKTKEKRHNVYIETLEAPRTLPQTTA
jgi:hypothetical protein